MEQIIKTLEKCSEQLCDIGIVLEGLAGMIGRKESSTLRTEATMPQVDDAKQVVAEMDREILRQSESPAGEVVDPIGFLSHHGITNPVWDLDLQQAADLMGVPKNTVQYLADKFGLPHFMQASTGRGPAGRCRIYSWTACVQYMITNYSRDQLPGSSIKLLTATEAAKVLEVSGNTVGAWAKSGELPCVCYGQRRYFYPTDVMHYAKESISVRS